MIQAFVFAGALLAAVYTIIVTIGEAR